MELIQVGRFGSVTCTQKRNTKKVATMSTFPWIPSSCGDASKQQHEPFRVWYRLSEDQLGVFERLTIPAGFPDSLMAFVTGAAGTRKSV